MAYLSPDDLSELETAFERLRDIADEARRDPNTWPDNRAEDRQLRERIDELFPPASEPL